MVAVLVVSATWHQAEQLRHVLGDAHPTRDYVIYEINVQQVLKGKQFFGPYSQWFHHPGPAHFYWLALPYVLLGQTTFALYLGGQILTVLFVLGSAIALSRWAKSNTPLVLFVPFVALELGYLGDFPLFDFWPPYVLFFGYGLFVLLCAGVSAGHVAALAPAAALGSLIVQTHVSYAPAVGVAVAVTATYVGRARGWSWPHARAHAALAIAVLITLWAQPLYGDLVAGKHNFARLRHVFFEMSPRHWKLSALLDRVALELSGPFQFALFRDRFIVPQAPKHYGAAKVIAFVEVVALIAAWRRSSRSADRFSEALCLSCLLSIGIATWSVAKIRGEVAPHHTACISILGFVSVLAAASSRPSPTADESEPQPLMRTLGIVAAWTAYVYLWPIGFIAPIHQNTEVATLASSVIDALRRDHVARRPRIAWGHTSNPALDIAEYDWATAVMFELEKRHIPFFTVRSPDLRWMIGAPHWEGADDGAPAVSFAVGARQLPGKQIACVPNGGNYFMRYPVCAWLSNPSE